MTSDISKKHNFTDSNNKEPESIVTPIEELGIKKSNHSEELLLANIERDRRADELVLANKELVLANMELEFQNLEKCTSFVKT